MLYIAPDILHILTNCIIMHHLWNGSKTFKNQGLVISKCAFCNTNPYQDIQKSKRFLDHFI